MQKYMLILAQPINANLNPNQISIKKPVSDK
jgi:hypothetical protein